MAIIRTDQYFNTSPVSIAPRVFVLRIASVLTGVLWLALAGCSDTDNGLLGEGGENGSVEAQLQGDWLYCLENPDGSGEGVRLSFDTGQFVQETARYADAACALTPDVTASSAGSYALGDRVLTSSGLEVQEIDYVFTRTDSADQATRVYDLVYIQNNSILYRGLVTDVNDGLSPDARPNDIFFSQPFDRRQ